MDLTCPSCHKHKFTVWNFIVSRFGTNEIPQICPHCGSMFSLSKKSGNIINLITVVAFLAYLVPSAILFSPDRTSPILYLLAIGGVAVAAGSRAFAIVRYGKLAPNEIKKKQEYPHIRLEQVRGELDWLMGAKTFFVLFSPDESGYLSFEYRKGAVVADLAFAIGKFEELRPRFARAVEKVGAQSKPYKKRGMRGMEADLGSNLDQVSNRIQGIMQEMFEIRREVEIPVMRQV